MLSCFIIDSTSPLHLPLLLLLLTDRIHGGPMYSSCSWLVHVGTRKHLILTHCCRPLHPTHQHLDKTFLLLAPMATGKPHPLPLVSENKVLTHPSSVDSITTSAGTEDHVSMGGFAARKALTIVEHVEIGTREAHTHSLTH